MVSDQISASLYQAIQHLPLSGSVLVQAEGQERYTSAPPLALCTEMVQNTDQVRLRDKQQRQQIMDNYHDGSMIGCAVHILLHCSPLTGVQSTAPTNWATIARFCNHCTTIPRFTLLPA